MQLFIVISGSKTLHNALILWITKHHADISTYFTLKTILIHFDIKAQSNNISICRCFNTFQHILQVHLLHLEKLSSITA